MTARRPNSRIRQFVGHCKLPVVFAVIMLTIPGSFYIADAHDESTAELESRVEPLAATAESGAVVQPFRE